MLWLRWKGSDLTRVCHLVWLVHVCICVAQHASVAATCIFQHPTQAFVCVCPIKPEELVITKKLPDVKVGAAVCSRLDTLSCSCQREATGAC